MLRIGFGVFCALVYLVYLYTPVNRQRVVMPFRVLRLHMEPPDVVLLMPVEGARVRRVVNTWSAPRPGGRKHQGQDIFAKRGTPVVSATDGIVVRVGTNTLGGNVVSVLGSGGRVYYYAHLDRYAEDIQTGEMVSAGTVLGYVGTTGNARATAPHLHFGVYTGSRAIDPLPLLVEPAVSARSGKKTARG